MMHLQTEECSKHVVHLETDKVEAYFLLQTKMASLHISFHIFICTHWLMVLLTGGNVAVTIFFENNLPHLLSITITQYISVGPPPEKS